MEWASPARQRRDHDDGATVRRIGVRDDLATLEILAGRDVVASSRGRRVRRDGVRRGGRPTRAQRRTVIVGEDDRGESRALCRRNGRGVADAVVIRHVRDGVVARPVRGGRRLHDAADRCGAQVRLAGRGPAAATTAAGRAFIHRGVGRRDGAGNVGCQGHDLRADVRHHICGRRSPDRGLDDLCVLA